MTIFEAYIDSLDQKQSISSAKQSEKYKKKQGQNVRKLFGFSLQQSLQKVKREFRHTLTNKQMEYVVDRKWKWVECNLVIKRLPQKQYQEGLYESLEAEIQLISEQPDIKNFQSDIIMDKSFEFEQGRGFIWHKSWYIPEISIKLSSKVTKMLREESHIKKIYCQMLSGYPFKKDQHFYLEEVKLEGDTLREFNKKGEANFSNIKFSETSFNKNKNKFSIILVIYTSYKQNEKSIIKSYISSPIHVDSRKQARKKISANTFIQDEISLSKFTTKLEGAQKLIGDGCSYEDLLTIYGFIKYYTAANIRFKIKHPYYIGYHFNNIFDIYYNSEEAGDPVEVLQTIYENEIKQNDRAKIKPKQKKDIFNDNKEILKKTSPKMLLFLIKNTPKMCYLIKDQIQPSDQKIVVIQKNLQAQNFQKPGTPQINLEKQVGQEKQVAQIKDPVLEETIAKNCLSHILQPHLRKEKNENVSELKEDEQQIGQEGAQKVIKEQENSELVVGFQPKSGEAGGEQGQKRQQKRSEEIKQEEAIKKIYSIFESWKFNFIYLKKSDGGLTVVNKKWVYIPPQELVESFKRYTKKKGTKGNQTNRPQDDGRQINGTNANSYLSYQIHQVIELQKSKSMVKMEENYFHVGS